MLRKRETFEESIHETDKKEKFFKRYLEDLLTKEGRLTYFKDYEFSVKQKRLKEYWTRAINLFMKHVLFGSMIYWTDIKEFFRYDGSGPMGLDRILFELNENRQFMILRDENKAFKKLGEAVKKNMMVIDTRKGLWDRIKEAFIKENVTLETCSIIVNIDYFVNDYRKVTNQIGELFKEESLLEESRFFNNFNEHFALNDLDTKAMVFLLLENKILKKERDGKFIFYFLGDEDSSLSVEIEKQQFMLNRQIESLETKIKKTEEEVNHYKKKAIECKKKGKKREGLDALREAKLLDNRLEHIRNQVMFLRDTREKLINSNSQKELTDLLKQTNSVLSQTEKTSEDLEKHLEMMRDLDDVTKNIHALVDEGVGEDDFDIEDIYNELDDVEEEKEDIHKQDIEKLKKDSEKDKITFGTLNNLTDTQLLDKQINDLRE